MLRNLLLPKNLNGPYFKSLFIASFWPPVAVFSLFFFMIKQNIANVGKKS